MKSCDGRSINSAFDCDNCTAGSCNIICRCDICKEECEDYYTIGECDYCEECMENFLAERKHCVNELYHI